MHIVASANFGFGSLLAMTFVGLILGGLITWLIMTSRQLLKEQAGRAVYLSALFDKGETVEILGIVEDGLETRYIVVVSPLKRDGTMRRLINVQHTTIDWEQAKRGGLFVYSVQMSDDPDFPLATQDILTFTGPRVERFSYRFDPADSNLAFGVAPGFDGVGSGSGLLDLTRERDDDDSSELLDLTADSTTDGNALEMFPNSPNDDDEVPSSSLG